MAEVQRFERMSDIRRRELQTEQKLLQAEQNLEQAFSKGDLKVTQIDENMTRIRAFIPDEDGYAGYIEQAYYAGVICAQRAGATVYIAEQFFPYRRQKLRSIWEFTPSAGRIEVIHTSGDQLDQTAIPVPADSVNIGYFWTMAGDLESAMAFENYDGRHHEGDEFLLPELQ